jgi:hypothetical protein
MDVIRYVSYYNELDLGPLSGTIEVEAVST